MPVNPYNNMRINSNGTTPTRSGLVDRLRPYRDSITYFMFLSFFVVLFAFILINDFVPDELKYDNPAFETLMVVVVDLFFFSLVLMLLSPVAAIGLYPEYRVTFLVLGVVLWVLTASAWFYLLSLFG